MVSFGFLFRIKKKILYVIGLLCVFGGFEKNMFKDLNGFRYGYVCKEFFLLFFCCCCRYIYNSYYICMIKKNIFVF